MKARKRYQNRSCPSSALSQLKSPCFWPILSHQRVIPSTCDNTVFRLQYDRGIEAIGREYATRIQPKLVGAGERLCCSARADTPPPIFQLKCCHHKLQKKMHPPKPLVCGLVAPTDRYLQLEKYASLFRKCKNHASCSSNSRARFKSPFWQFTQLPAP